MSGEANSPAAPVHPFRYRGTDKVVLAVRSSGLGL